MHTTQSPDSPVALKENDSLSRWFFAEDIVNLVESLTKDTSVRLGIYGGWGTGKTSLLSFIETLLVIKGYPVIHFDPWKYHTYDELWRAFSDTIAIPLYKENKIEGLVVKAKNWIYSIFNKGGEIGNSIATKYAGSFGGAISNSVYDIIKEPANNFFKLKRKVIEKRIIEISSKQKLIILIDDLDRTGPELLPEILMHLRSVLDLKGCIYILSLDPKVVGSALAKINPEWSDGYSFLEKIIEYPLWLPEPSQEQWEAMLMKEADKSKDNIDLSILLKIIKLLPQNPRKLKLFIRYIAGLKSKLSRYRDDEINLPTLYIAQLLKLEFPEDYKKILDDEGFCKEICLGSFPFENSENEEREKKFQSSLNSLEITDKNKNDRFQQLIFGLKKHHNISDESNLSSYFYFLEEECLLTWKEYLHFVSIWENTQSDLDKENLIKPYLESKKCSFIFQKTIKYRHHSLAEAVDETLEENIKEKLKSANVALSILAAIIEKGVCSREDKLLISEDFYKFFSHIKYWSRFSEQDFYKQCRQAEYDLFLKLVASSQEQNVIFLEKLLKENDYSEINEEFNDFQKKIRSFLEKSSALSLLNIFKTPYLFGDLWGETEHYAYKEQLLRSDSYFHNYLAIQSQLSELETSSLKERGVHQNFYDAFTMISFYSLNSPYAVTVEEVRRLIKEKKDFIGFLWKGITSRRLNRRMVGTLNKMRNEHKIIVGTTEHLPLPNWWNEILEGR